MPSYRVLVVDDNPAIPEDIRKILRPSGGVDAALEDLEASLFAEEGPAASSSRDREFETLGHAAGDELLREVAGRLRESVRDADTIARMGGDEFVILLEEVDQGHNAALAAERVLEACSRTVVVEDQSVRTPPSIGVGLWPGDGADVEAILRCADLAMYRAKQDGGACYRFFDGGTSDRAREHLQRRADLAGALDRGELALWYQPLFELAGGEVRGMEALLRWEHPQDGMVSPAEFIPEAERSGLIVPIGRWVLETACAQLAAWHRAGARDLSVAVNVSVRQLREPGFVDIVRGALAKSGLNPSRLELELTESTAFADVETAKRVLTEIADLGVRILIDDFGSGHSSLNRLKALPVDGVKIDRFFFNNIADDPRDAAVVMAMVTMAHALGIDVVAEGIETAEQLERLRTMHWEAQEAPLCDRVQGFLLGRPATARDAEAWVFREASPAKPPAGDSEREGAASAEFRS